MRPSIQTERPFFRYWAQFSPCLPHTIMLCHSVRSCRAPALSANCSVVAIEKLVTDEPELVKRVSGSRPRLPMRITLFTDAAIFTTSSSEKVVPPRTQGKETHTCICTTSQTLAFTVDL